ncbi:flagellar protein FlaG [Acidaminobacter sp. JC074]|uniref:flagellar protein FlaG n=1 Tax=Acidaminobacter sp. JC074 TaxID=2530199 RepID=UPI001F101359|nr:flagellar protein FlaG [Acidaminobacter sp. JC074]
MKIDGMSGLQGTVASADKVSVEKPAYQPKVAKSLETKDVSGDAPAFQEGVEQHQDVINDEMLDKAIEMANKTLAKHNNFIERTVHETTKTMMYVMKDTETNEVIKEFPPKKIQDMIAKMWEIAGLFVDEKA